MEDVHNPKHPEAEPCYWNSKMEAAAFAEGVKFVNDKFVRVVDVESDGAGWTVWIERDED